MFKNKINKKIGKYVELSNIMLIFSESTCLMKTFQKEMNVKVS